MEGWPIEPHWVWVTLGLLLAALEILVPGVYLIWLAVAAVITGLLTFAFDIGLAMQVVVFASLSMISVFSARRYLRESPIESSDPLLNHRAARMVGETALVTQAFDGGTGRVRHGDSEWLARGPDLDVGVRVRIIGNDGTILLVEPLEQPGAKALADESGG